MSSMYGVSNWPTKNAALKIWVIEMAEMCQPDNIVWIDGSEEEKKRLTDEALEPGS